MWPGICCKRASPIWSIGLAINPCTTWQFPDQWLSGIWRYINQQLQFCHSPGLIFVTCSAFFHIWNKSKMQFSKENFTLNKSSTLYNFAFDSFSILTI
jgi:hypothetical protein